MDKKDGRFFEGMARLLRDVKSVMDAFRAVLRGTAQLFEGLFAALRKAPVAQMRVFHSNGCVVPPHLRNPYTGVQVRAREVSVPLPRRRFPRKIP